MNILHFYIKTNIYMIYIGLDLSINSTGICIYDSETHNTTYYIIGSKFTKKVLNDNQRIITLIQYSKETPNKDIDYHIKEKIKTLNIYNIVNEIESLINKHHPGVGVIEGISFQSNGSVADLAGLNYMVRKILIDRNIDIIIASPTQNKKYATGNGQAEKDVMISAWRKADTRVCEIPTYIKVDDVADAYFLARYGEYLTVER